MFPNFGALRIQEASWPPVVETGGDFIASRGEQVFSFDAEEVKTYSASQSSPTSPESSAYLSAIISPQSSTYLSAMSSTVSGNGTGREMNDVIGRLESLQFGSNTPISSTPTGTVTGIEYSPSFGSFAPPNYTWEPSYMSLDYMNGPYHPFPLLPFEGGREPGVADLKFCPIPSSSEGWRQFDNLQMLEGQSGLQVPAPKLRLNAYPEKVVNFTNCQIRFRIHSINMPVGVNLSSCRMEGWVISPSGKFRPCRIVEVEKTNPYQMDFFTGTFQSWEEVGLYLLRVRLIFPLESRLVGIGMDSEGTYEEAGIVVSKNYFKDSQNISSLSIQLEFIHMQGGQKYENGGQMVNTTRPYYYSKAWGISCDKLTNRLYCTDRNAHSLTCLDPEGQVIFKLPRCFGSHTFNRPTGICCDEMNRRLIVADKDNHRISFFSMDGEYLSSFGVRGHANGCFDFPWDVAVSPRGNRIAVADSRNKRIQLFDRDGNFVNKFSIFETNPFEYKHNFDYPRGITFDNEGTFVYVTDFQTHHIVEIPVDDMSTYRKLPITRKLFRPQGVVMDSLSNLLFCDSKNQCIRHVRPQDGQVLAQIYSVGKERFQFPVNLTLMGDGRVAVLDSYAKIRIF